MLNKIEKKDLLKKSSYFYDLPEELIAQEPVEPRDSSRLIIFDRKNNNIEHKIFKDIISYLTPNDVLVINNTRVLPARLYGYKDTGAKIEILLQKRINLNSWQIIAKPFKRFKEGTKITFSNELACIIEKKENYGLCEVTFIYDGVFEDKLSKVGQVPLPPYIHAKLKDKERYQTVYSKIEGSSAAPTAGLHFTNELLTNIKKKGVEIIEVLLHVGLGTFRPVKEDNILEHQMHSEYIEMSVENAHKLNQAKQNLLKMAKFKPARERRIYLSILLINLNS